MTRFGRVPRRPDHWRSPHERARVRLTERMVGELGPEEAAWLDEHVAGCPRCASVATQYAADRVALRALRDAAPEPPRDLWARTAAAIERESGSRHGAAGTARRARSPVPIGVLSGLAVVALVIGVSTLSRSIVMQPQTAGPAESPEQASTTNDAGGGPIGAQATPFAVGAGAVQWVDKTASGTLAYNHASVDEVCPAEGTSRCPALKSAAQQRLTVDSTPRRIIGSPTDGQAVMIADDGSGGDQLVLVDLPEPAGTPAPSSATPAPTPTDTATPSVAPAATASAGAGDPANTPEPSGAAPSVEPSETAGTDTSAPSPDVTAAIPSPSLSPEPTVAASLAIASDIELVGESAAFSASGSWFAFTARPADGSRGPDVYVWRVGDESARAITTDGSSVFGSWDGDQVIASRPDTAALPGEDVTAASVRIDPATAEESPAGDVWRPVVDPTGRRAIGWSGSVAPSDDGTNWSPTVGRLELRPWSDRGAVQADARPAPDESVVADSAAAGFDVRWDERGEWVAVWVADAGDPSVGRLTLYQVDAGRGALKLPDDAPTDVPALPGFSIGEGRLAWATPPGQDGEGSRIQIVAWGEDGVGSVESAPGDDLVVIR